MKKFFKVIIFHIARKSGVERHIRLQQRIDLASELEVGAIYFRDSLWKSPRVANAFWLCAIQLRAGDDKPDMTAVITAVTKAGNNVLFEQRKEETTNG